MMKPATLLGILAGVALVAGGGFLLYQFYGGTIKKTPGGSGSTGSAAGSGTKPGTSSSGSGTSAGSGTTTPPAGSTAPAAAVTGKATKVGQRIYALDNTTPYYYQGLGTPIAGYYFPPGSYIGTTNQVTGGYLKVTSFTGPPKDAKGKDVNTFYIPNKNYRLG